MNKTWEKMEKDGDILFDASGLWWCFWPTSNKGAWDSHALRALADHLDKKNKPIYDEYEAYCAGVDNE